MLRFICPASTGGVMINIFSVKEICEKIMRCDTDIRMVAVSYRTEFYYMTRPGTKVFQTKEETEKSLADATLRWVSRRSIKSIGKPIYAMAKYEKVKRITLPLGRYGIILCTTNSDADADLISSKIIRITRSYKE